MSTILIIVLALLPRNQGTSITNTHIEEIYHPGLIFKHLYEVNFINEQWDMVVAIDTEWEKLKIPALEKRINLVQAIYLQQYDDPMQKFKFQLLTQKLAEIYNNFQQVDIKIRYLEGDLKEIDLSRYRDTIRLMREEYTDTLLYYQNYQIITESSMSRITHTDEKKYNSIYRKLYELEVQQGGNQTQRKIEIRKIVKEVDNLTTKYIIISRNLLETVKAIMEKRPCVHLLTTDDLLVIKNDIEENSKNKLSLANTDLKFENLLKIGQFNYGIRDRTIIVKIRVPLVNKEHSTLLEMKSFGATQKGNISLSIRPRYPYILVNKQGYYFANSQELSRCQKFQGKLICPEQWFTYNEETTCEYELLTNPRKLDYRTCDLRYKQHPIKTIYCSNTGDEWIYTLTDSVTLTLQEKNMTLTLKGAGRLKFLSNTTATVKNTTFLITTGERNISDFIIPKRNLTFNDIIFTTNNSIIYTKLRDIIEHGGNEQDIGEIITITNELYHYEKELDRIKEILIIFAGLALSIILLMGILFACQCYQKIIINDLLNEQVPPATLPDIILI